MLNHTIVKKFGFPETVAPKRATGRDSGGNFQPVRIFFISYIFLLLD
jgi:hypothetical protein